MKSRSKVFVDKSVGAMLSAIEVYNKPSFLYREDTFAVLAINAWELLLKARLLQINNNKLSSIQVYESRTNKDGSRSEKKYIKYARTGNPMTIGLLRAYDLLVSEHGDTIDNLVRDNIVALTDIRDNSIHFVNSDLRIARQVQEIGTASIKNFVKLVRQWFGRDLSEYNFFLMPLAFFRDGQGASGIDLTPNESKFVEMMSKLQNEASDDEASDFNFSLGMDIKLRRVSLGEQVSVTVSNDPDAIKVTLAEEDVREKYPWDYQMLITKVSKKYPEHKMNNKFHAFMKSLKKNPKFCVTRFLDTGNQKSPKKDYYNPNILRKFDDLY